MIERLAGAARVMGSGVGRMDPIFAGRERRMHVRALEAWTAACRGAAMPPIGALDRAQFVAHSLVIDLPAGPPGPSIAYVGAALREEARVPDERPSLGDVPAGSLLGELLRHYPRIVAHRAPVEFEAEFVSHCGVPTLYRGILLPYARADGRIAAVHGVIGWRTEARVATADIAAAFDSAMTGAPAAPAACPWQAAPATALPPQSFDQRVAAARTWAALAAGDRTRRADKLHVALGAAHDLLLDEPGCAAEAIVGLVFGGGIGQRDRNRFTHVLDHALRLGLGPAMLPALLDRHPHGYRGIAAAERRACRSEARGRVSPVPTIPSGRIALAPLGADFLLTLGRRTAARPIEAPRRAVG